MHGKLGTQLGIQWEQLHTIRNQQFFQSLVTPPLLDENFFDSLEASIARINASDSPVIVADELYKISRSLIKVGQELLKTYRASTSALRIFTFALSNLTNSKWIYEDRSESHKLAETNNEIFFLGDLIKSCIPQPSEQIAP